MKTLAKVVACLGFTALMIGAAMFDSESLVLPTILCFSGVLGCIAGAYVIGDFWEWEEI